MLFVVILVAILVIYIATRIPYRRKTSDEYYNTILEDGKSIREHVEEDYKHRLYFSSKQAKRDFPKSIEEQYRYIIRNVNYKSNKYQDFTNDEEIIIKTFLEKVAQVRKKYSVNIERSSNGMIRINYNGYPTGQFNLREQKYIRILRGMQIIDKDNPTNEEIMKAIDSWVRYCKYQLKESHFGI